MPRTITSLEGFIRKIRAVQPAADEVLIYRGHADRRQFRLRPSVLRDPKLAAVEHSILRELVASHPQEFSYDRTTLEQLARVQHYTLPTRLLDVTWNPLVALYFTCSERDSVTGEVIVFRVKKSLVKYYDSDAVSLVANLAHLKPSERESIDFTLHGAEFNSQPPIDRLLQFIRVEKPYFRPEVVPDHLQTVLFVKPKRNTQRILAQSGAFLIFGMFDELDNARPEGLDVERIQVSGSAKASIRRELDRMAINESTMFPELEKAASYIRSTL